MSVRLRRRPPLHHAPRRRPLSLQLSRSPPSRKTRRPAYRSQHLWAFYGDQIISATGLSFALARTMAATAQGHIKPKTAAIIAYLGQTLVQAIQQANQEYVQVFGSAAWREAIRSCFEPVLESSPPTPEPPPDPAPDSTSPPTPDPTPTPPSAPDNAATQPASDNATPIPTPTTAASPTTTQAGAASSAPPAKGADVSDSERAPNAEVAPGSPTDARRKACSRGLQTAGFRANGEHNPTPPTTPAPSAQLTSTKSPQPPAAKPPLPKDAKSFANEVLSQLRNRTTSHKPSS